jgi:hypothetical protein
MPRIEPSVVLANALDAVHIESPALIDIATKLPVDLGRGFSVHTDGEFLALWCEVRVADVVASLATIGTAVPWAPSGRAALWHSFWVR